MLPQVPDTDKTGDLVVSLCQVAFEKRDCKFRRQDGRTGACSHSCHRPFGYCQRPGASWISANSSGRCFWSKWSILEARGTPAKEDRRGFTRSFSQYLDHSCVDSMNSPAKFPTSGNPCSICRQPVRQISTYDCTMGNWGEGRLFCRSPALN